MFQICLSKFNLCSTCVQPVFNVCSNLCRRYTKGIRLAQTTMGTLLCSSLRDSLMADCAVINAGNIRGNTLYEDDKHSVTYADLKSEIPFDSKVTVAGPVSRPLIVRLREA